MSISSMTDLAMLRRSDDLGVRPLPRTLAATAAATGGKPEAENSGTAALKTIATYIPTEVIALYLAALAAVRSATGVTTVSHGIAQRTGSASHISGSELWTFGVFAVVTPLVVWLLYAGKVKTAGKKLPLSPRKWPWWEISASAIAFTAWAFALPQSPFARFSWYTLAWATFVVLVVSTALGLLAPVFVRGSLRT
jgi:hypothetical protein